MTKPVNLRGYYYPHIQKNTIEALVKNMLQQGIIKNSRSPFTSSVMLVKKKDQTWCMCVDYRQLMMCQLKTNILYQ